MDTKAKTNLWLLDQSPPLITSSDRLKFAGAYPPTCGQVFLQFHGYHRYLQSTSKLQSSTKDAIKLVVQNVKDWWANTGIPTKTNQAMEKMVLHHVDEYKRRKSHRNRKTKAEETNREGFISQMKQTFWAVQPSYESQLQKWKQQEKGDQRHKEDWLYLEKVRGESRTATLGNKDMKLAAKRRRSQRDDQALKAKPSAKSSSSLFPTATATMTSSESESESVSDEKEFIPTGSTSNTQPSTSKAEKSEGIPNTAYLVADKYGLSNRALTELAAAFQTSEGKNLNQLNLSVNTTRRRKANVRKSTAEDIVQSQLGDVNQKRFALHWDGKLIKALTHVANDVERVAVLLTGIVCYGTLHYSYTFHHCILMCCVF